MQGTSPSACRTEGSAHFLPWLPCPMILADSTLIVQGTTLPSGTQFVPMIYAASDATTANLNTAKSYKTGIVLGFNEPNEANQADNTVAVGVLLSLDHCVGKQDSFRGMLIGQLMPMGAGDRMQITLPWPKAMPCPRMCWCSLGV